MISRAPALPCLFAFVLRFFPRSLPLSHILSPILLALCSPLLSYPHSYSTVLFSLFFAVFFFSIPPTILTPRTPSAPLLPRRQRGRAETHTFTPTSLRDLPQSILGPDGCCNLCEPVSSSLFPFQGPCLSPPSPGAASLSALVPPLASNSRMIIAAHVCLGIPHVHPTHTSPHASKFEIKAHFHLLETRDRARSFVARSFVGTQIALKFDWNGSLHGDGIGMMLNRKTNEMD